MTRVDQLTASTPLEKLPADRSRTPSPPARRRTGAVLVARVAAAAGILLFGLQSAVFGQAPAGDAGRLSAPGGLKMQVPTAQPGNRPLLAPAPGLATPPAMDFGATRLPAGAREVLARSAPVPHRLYVIAADGRAWQDTWTGSIVLPELLRDAGLALVTVKTREAALHSYWFSSSDGTLSRYVTTQDGRSLGLVSITPVGTMQLIVDHDGDRLADFFYESGPLRDTLILARDAAGLDFLNRFLGGTNPFCGPPFSGARGRPVDLPKLPDGTPLGRFNACSGRDGGAAAASPFAAPARDAIDQACSQFARTGAGPGPGAIRDDAGITAALGVLAGLAKQYVAPAATWLLEEAFVRGFISMEVAMSGSAALATISRFATPVGAFATVTLTPSKTHASSCEMRGAGACAAEHEARQRDRAAPKAADAARASTSGAGSAQKSGDDKKGAAAADGSKHGAPAAGDDGSARGLAALCEARAKSAANRPPTALADLDRRAVKSDCGDPVVNPSPARTATAAAGTTPSLKCTPDVEAQTLGRAREVFAGSGSGCRPGQRPGPDGTCAGGKGEVVQIGANGRSGVGFGALIGIELCDPKRCAPPPR